MANEHIAKLPHKAVITAGGGLLSVPKFIRRIEYDGKRYWQVEPGPSGVFTTDARTRTFSDYKPWESGNARDPAISLQEAVTYLTSIYRHPAARPTIRSRLGGRFMPPGLELKLRKHPPRVCRPNVWVIVVREASRKYPHEVRQYVEVGEDGNISQDRFIDAMRKALELRESRLIRRQQYLKRCVHV